MPYSLHIIHGFEANPHGNWFDDLCHRAEQQGIIAHTLELPNSHQPHPNAWQAALDSQISALNKHCILVAHSLGCLTTLRYLSRHRPSRLGGLLLAAGFFEPLPALPQLNDYITKSQPDFAALRQIHTPITCLISDNDSHVPPSHSQHLAAELNASITWIANGGHLMASDGFTQLPQAWQAVRNMIEAV